jgi:hypothetical protein
VNSFVRQHQTRCRDTRERYEFWDGCVNKDFSDPSDLLSTPDVVTFLLEREYADGAAGAMYPFAVQ